MAGLLEVLHYRVRNGLPVPPGLEKAGSWVGPLIGTILLGSLQQIITVTISSAANLLLVGGLLVFFVIAAPNGIIGLVHKYLQRKPDDFVGRRRVDLETPAPAAPAAKPAPGAPP